MQDLSILRQSTIAVVGADDGLRGAICGILRQAGFQAWGAPGVEDFYVSLLHSKANLVIADGGLADASGLSLVRRLAAQGVPTVLLVPRGDLQGRIAGLEAGALQCHARSVDLRELVAGVRAILRYVSPGGSGVAKKKGVASWRIDQALARLLAPNLQAVPLTYNELSLLQALFSARGELVGKADLLRALAGQGEKDDFHRVESLLTRLRRKTQLSTGMVLPVRNVFGKGFIFDAEMEA